MQISRARPAVHVSILIAVGLGARLLVVPSLASLPWFSQPNADSAVYDSLAKAFSGGDLLMGAEPLRMSPVYPFFLGLVYRLFGDGTWAIRAVQTVLGLGLVVLTWDIARQLLGNWAAFVAGGLVALFGPAMFYEAQLLSDAPAAAAAALALWMMVRATVRGDTRASAWLLVGFATGAVALFRPNAILLAAPLGAAAVWTGAPSGVPAVRIAVAALGFVLALSPVPIRNQLATGRATLTAVHGGINFYVGNGPDASGAFRIPNELSKGTGPQEQFEAFHTVAEHAVGRPLDARAVDRYWTRRTLTYISDHPTRWLTLMLWKLRLFWNGRSISDIEHYDFTRSLDPILAWPFVQWWALMPLALLGTVLSLRTRGPAAIVALFNLAWCAGVVLFFVIDRYRLPSLSGFAVAAALALSQAPKIWALASQTRRVALILMVVVAAAVSWPVGVVDNFGDMWLRLGADYEQIGRLDEARGAYRHALEIAPADSRARFSLERVSGQVKQ